MVKYYVYVLVSLKNDKKYIGSTNDLERRLVDHNRGKSKSVRNRGPFKILYTEEYNSRSEAMKRERQIKGYKGGNEFKKLLK